ncbi:MAG: NosD domain-containing protein [Spartobacteria bacterium]
MRWRFCPGSARVSRAGDGVSPQQAFSSGGAPGKVRNGQDAITSTRDACAARIIACALLALTSSASALTLQQQIDAAAPNETLKVAAGVHPGSITINKPLQLIAEPGAEIRGTGAGNVVTITAANVGLHGFRIRGSGLRLSDDNAAVFVAGDHVTIERNVIEDSLHGIYLKKVRDCRVIGNRIRGKTTLLTTTKSVKETLTAGIGELCEAPLNENERGNGIHQWNCERILVSGNEISDTRDGIYFSFTNHSRTEDNQVHDTRYGLHYMYSDNNVFENNLFAQNAAGAAVMFSHDVVIRGNRFVDNRGSRAYGILFQSDERVRVENNLIRNNAVGLSFQQAIDFVVRANEISGNYIGLRFYGNSDGNTFTENRFAQNLHPIDVDGAGDNNRWAVNGVGNFWSGQEHLDLNGDGINDLPHHELDLFGPLRRDFPAVALLSGSPVVKLLRFANERAEIPGTNSITDPAPLTANFWTIRAQSAVRQRIPKP